MWPRRVEALFGLWLALSVFVFAVPVEQRLVWFVDLGAGLVIITISLLCRWPPAARGHLVTLAIALALVAYGLAQPRPIVAWHENHILVGLLLAMISVLPTRVPSAPRAWRAHGGMRQ